VVKISKNEYFHSLVRIAYLFNVLRIPSLKKIRGAYPTALRLSAMLEHMFSVQVCNERIDTLTETW
jgi:hypothetical protein